ncbi:MAG: hypothetical protein GFH27_549293n270 [Chloroflexi bacterium AL-W]|nr:hypothetical protein [Chloroflexi bacterium AL-N1]NOK67615.1 hypothetical protein [Chloroflexi bacterium AL-N10]NOK75615.1 hypothetical protein [Chloroflexi bacterium AL-N5]NOK82403.1 hypothetical protein [Chloroflexi bacterium AL-W]NOK90248.1 hypothetical protein [Chloroflexi bacterium AL-N15]
MVVTDLAPVTELDLLVGSILTTRPEEDRFLYEEEYEWLLLLQKLLQEHNVEIDLFAQPGVQIWEGGITRFLDFYQLRLLAVYLEHNHSIDDILAVSPGMYEKIDHLLASVLERQQPTQFLHLIDHQIDGGYYLPVDFADPIWIDVSQDQDVEDEDVELVSFGSSIVLQQELTILEHLLRTSNVPREHPAFRCLQILQTATEQSVRNNLPIIIW